MTDKPPFAGERIPFPEAFTEVSRGVRKVKQGDSLVSGEHPVIDQGQEVIAGYANGDDGLFVDVPAIVFGDHTRCVKYVDTPFFAGADGVKILKPRASDNVRYWYHALRNTPLENLGYSRHFKLLKQTSFVSRDSEGQALVVRNLDAVLGLKRLVDEQISKLDDLVKSRFVEMFGDGNLLMSRWPHKPLGQCVRSIDSGKSVNCKAGARLNGEAGVLKLSALSSGRYLPSENKAMFEGERVLPGKEVVPGDILIARKNTPELVGASVLVDCDEPNLMFPDLVFRMHPVDGINGFYLSTLLGKSSYSSHVRDLAHGSAKSMSNIPKSKLALLPIPLPPLSLQREFADFAARVDKLRVDAQAQKERLRTLYDGLAQNYFAI